MAAPSYPRMGNHVQLGSLSLALRREMLQTHQCRSTHSNLAGAQITCTELCSAACWKLQLPLVPVARVICPWRILFFQWRQESKLYWTQNPRHGRRSSGKPHLKHCSPSNGASVLCCLLQSHTHSPRREGRMLWMESNCFSSEMLKKLFILSVFTGSSTWGAQGHPEIFCCMTGPQRKSPRPTQGMWHPKHVTS